MNVANPVEENEMFIRSLLFVLVFYIYETSAEKTWIKQGDFYRAVVTLVMLGPYLYGSTLVMLEPYISV